MTASVDADAARRFGGGGSYGRSAPTFSQKSAPATPTAQPRQSQNQNQAQNPSRQQQTTQTPQQRPSMMRNVLTGLAAALGISALLSMLGLGGAGIASFVTGALLAVVAFFALRFLLGAFLGRKTAPAQCRTPEGMSQTTRVEPQPAQQPENRPQVSSFSTDGARRGSVMDEFRSGSFGAAAPAQTIEADGTADVTPADFDREAFLRVAKENFVKLQKAWDTGNVIELSDFTTQELFVEITHALRERGAQNYETTVLHLDNQLIGIAQQNDEYVAVVHFTGKLSVSGEEETVDDDWILTKPVSGNGGWLLAGVSGKE